LRAANPDIYEVPRNRRIYNRKKGWYKFEPPAGIDDAIPNYHGKFVSETLPPSLYSIIPPAPCWLNNNIAISRGYLDDACDGIVEVKLKGRKGATPLSAIARITAGPAESTSESTAPKTGAPPGPARTVPVTSCATSAAGASSIAARAHAPRERRDFTGAPRPGSWRACRPIRG
jgi:hypothetical protein